MSIHWTENAKWALEKIGRGDPKLAKQIWHAVAKYHDNGHGDVKSLKGSAGELRVRVRKYRIKVEWVGSELVVVDVGHRGEVYR